MISTEPENHNDNEDHPLQGLFEAQRVDADGYF
jgi:hypothetical protein